MAFSELIAIYLFLGGTAAGAFALMSIADLGTALAFACDRRRYGIPAFPIPTPQAATRQRISKLVYSASFVMLAAGMLCLLADLGRPEAFYLLFTTPSGSLMSLGSFALVLLAVCMMVVLAWEALTLGSGWRKAALAAKAVGIVFAFIVMVYTGLLLQTAIAVPLWRSGWLWALFLLSSLSCGCAVIMLCTCACEGYRHIRRFRRRTIGADTAFIVLEAAVTVAFVLTVGADAAVHPLRALAAGGFAALFWLGFIGCGILVPLASEIALLAGSRSPSGTAAAILAAFVLVGGLCLRLVMVGAGVTPVV